MYQPVTKKNVWFERLMAILALISLLLALFDLSYIPWRSFYFRNIPQVTRYYDRYKGIEPHRETQRYLNAVEQLKVTVAKTGLNSVQTEVWLKNLGDLSAGMIQVDPFQVSHQSGHLEKIKNEMRDRLHNQSATGSFRTFWSQPYLAKAGWQKEIEFYDQKIKPLLVTNYYRRLDESGEFVDLFWEIDIIFIAIFTGELLGRIFFILRHNPGLNLIQAIAWRWYDLFLIMPIFRFLRIIPVTVRCHQAKLINLHTVQAALNRVFVGQIADEITETVVLQVLQQTQFAVQTGQMSKLIGSYLKRPHLDLNNVNEIEAIIQIILEVAIYRVIPKIQPDLEEIVRHIFQKALQESPAYRNLQLIPGVRDIPNQTIDRVVKELSESMYTALTKILADPETGKISHQLAENLTHAIADELKRGHTTARIESLVYDLIEEIKVTYTTPINNINRKS
jgi:hypothetical protein